MEIRTMLKSTPLDAGSVGAGSPGGLVSAMFKLQVVVHSRLWTGKRQQAAAVQGEDCGHRSEIRLRLIFLS